MRLADDADFPATGHEPGDDVGPHMGLARSGRTLHRQVGVVKGQHGRRDGFNEAVRSGTRLRQ
ncbi:hypothetical protein SRABI128_06460 [Microbacterium sp. Bi128]|nr:hypothetical protein SRABI128_06460 [Microbacterium sp. Bi128]